ASTEDGVRPLIFQDVDGVLNRSPTGAPIDAELLGNLADLARRTDANIVISSAWRKSPPALRELLGSLRRDAGVPTSRLLGATPSLCPGVECRAAEISSWLRAHPRQAAGARWVAIDDRDLGRQDPDLLRGHFVRTDGRVGLTRERALAAERLLLPAGAAARAAGTRRFL
ncbi:unnamed protein product, partial [Prorocentrum cordatum]